MAIAYVALGSNLGDKKKNLQRALMLLMQQAMYSIPGGDSKDLSAAWVDDGEGSYVLAIYVSDYSGNGGGSSIGDADPQKVTDMTNKVNELFGSQVMDPNDAGGAGEAVPLDETTANTTGEMTEEVIGGADTTTATFVAGN